MVWFCWLNCTRFFLNNIRNHLEIVCIRNRVQFVSFFGILQELLPYTNILKKPTHENSLQFAIEHKMKMMKECKRTAMDVKFPHMIRHFLARVRATFNRWGFARKPTPVVRAVDKMMISFSWPWYESIVLTGKSYPDSVLEFLRKNT